MNAAGLLKTLHRIGAVVSVQGDDLLIDSAADLPAPLLADLRSNKPQLMALLSADAANDHAAQSSLDVYSRELDLDGLTVWLHSEVLCLVLREGLLSFTGPDGQGTGEPSTALRQHVESHRTAIVELLSQDRE